MLFKFALLLIVSSRRKVTAEELYKESLASDNDQWLFFQIEKVPASQQIEELKMWLATNKPSQVREMTSCEDTGLNC